MSPRGMTRNTEDKNASGRSSRRQKGKAIEETKSSNKRAEESSFSTLVFDSKANTEDREALRNTLSQEEFKIHGYTISTKDNISRIGGQGIHGVQPHEISKWHRSYAQASSIKCGPSFDLRSQKGSSRRSRLLQRSHRIATTARMYRKDRVNFHDSALPIGPSTGQSHLELQTHRLGRLQGAYLDSWIGLFGSLIMFTLVGFSIFILATSTIGMSGTFRAQSTDGEVFFYHALSTPRLTSMMPTRIPIRARKRGRLVFMVPIIVMPDDL